MSDISKNPLPDAMQTKLTVYADLLRKWQVRINLISTATLADIETRHFQDSLQLSGYISDQASVYDLGSGAGFPGMVLAIARPDVKVTLIESDAKKCAFLKTVSRETATNVAIRNERIERTTEYLSAPDFVTARALTQLSDLLDLSKPWARVNPNLQALFLKGQQAEVEIDVASEKGWFFACKIHQSQTSEHGKILHISEIRPPDIQIS